MNERKPIEVAVASMRPPHYTGENVIEIDPATANVTLQ